MRFGALPLLLSLAAMTALSATHADSLTGRVVAVTDGDTITILDTSNTQHKIRLSGIDAPEKTQPFGQVCKQSLSDLAYDRTVQVDWDKLDRYGRVIGKVLVNGQDVNLEQIRRGCAWHYKKYQNEQSPEDRMRYARQETDARGRRAGIWAEKDAVPPWEWRHRPKRADR